MICFTSWILEDLLDYLLLKMTILSISKKKDLIETMSRICSRLNENEIIDSLNQQFMHKAS